MSETVGGLKTYHTMDDYLGKGLPKNIENDIFAHFKKSINMWELFQQILQEKNDSKSILSALWYEKKPINSFG